MSDIKKTKLFKELKKLDKDFANDVLKNSNSVVELINKKTTINFPNYTNHDIRHSIKIMETMYELIKDKTNQLSSLEYVLMIYSAMFHDIGMAVSDKEIKKIKDNDSKYLYDQDFELIKENLYNNENLAIQEIVRNAHGKIANDLINTKYKELFKLPQSSTYFSEELGAICQAHTEDKSYLEKISTYETKGDDEYNPRFVAILLRVADILDIDDTRTPIELYKTIELSDFSDGEWQKNFVIDNRKKIFSRNKLKEIRLQGTCEDIKVHRKLLNYIKWIENELVILVNETANMKEHYHIQINTQVQNKIKSKGYTIPDLKLNMDYHAVTNLLMGEAIYGSKDLGLRELLQNSIDAIMVKKDKLEIEEHPSKDNYEPTINIDIDEENNKVIISDNGMGMNEYIIKNYFLNVGKSYYKSKDFLNYNHNYNPIGNFGIGFLSCFMLSNEVEVITKHFDSNKKYTIDLEKNSEYIAFKEEEDNSNESGTRIIINLDSLNKVFSSNDELELTIHKFVKTNILIDNFMLQVNKKNINNNILNNNEKNDNLHKINVSKYLKNIEGEIIIRQKKYSNSIIDELVNSEYLVYFNGKTFENLTNYNKLDNNSILTGFELEYLKIPLLKDNAENTFKILMESGHLDPEDAINSIISKQKNIKYIYVFINKDCFWLGTQYYGNFYDKDDYIFSYEKDGIESEITMEDIIDFLKLDDFEIIGGYYVKKELLHKDNYLFPYKKNKYSTKYGETFVKNIKINHNYDKYLLLDLINIVNINLNIKNNKLIPNISRDKLISFSEKKLTNSIFNLIYKYTLNNFILNKYEKKLLNAFILLNYKEDKEIEK